MNKQLLILGCIVAFAIPASAGTHKIPSEDPVAIMTLPDSWEVDEIEDGIEATSADGEVYFYVEATDADTVEEAMTEGAKYLGSKGVTVDEKSVKKEQTKLNGMDVIEISWDGKDKDGAAKISLAVVAVTKGDGLLLVYWASPEGEKKNAADLEKIANSIRKP